MYEKLMSILGIGVLLFIAYLLSENRKAIRWKTIGAGLILQFLFAVLLLWTSPGKLMFSAANDAVLNVIGFADQGAEFVFSKNLTSTFFVKVLSTIVFFSSLMSILFYFGIIQKIIGALARLMVKVMHVSGAEALSTCADVFLGQTESPLVIKPYLESLTRSEILTMMTAGMASISGGVLAAFVSFGIEAGHLLTASLMSAPAALLVAKLLLPETEESKTMGKVTVDIEIPDVNVFDAACRGASDGLKLALNVMAMLIAFVGLSYLLNHMLLLLPNFWGSPLSLERILSWIFTPISYAIGIEPADVGVFSSLLGKKIILNEFIAYLDLVKLRDQISPRTFTMATYALCGFANFGSIAIQIGGTGSLMPSRREDLARLGLKAMIGGTIATLLSATMAGLLLY